jgi:chitodextrinase
MLNEKGSLSSIGLPGDIAFDLVLDMNGTNKTISYIAIKKSSRSTNLWSTNQSGKSGFNTFDLAVGNPSMDTWVQPYGLLVTRNNQKLNDPNRKNILAYLGTYSGQTKVDFRIYADRYAGPDFNENSEIYIVFTDGTIISKKLSVSKNEIKPSNTDPVITKATVDENNVIGYWLWNIDLDLKNKNRNISYISIFMRNQRWSSDETYGSLLILHENGKVISNSSKKILGSIGVGSKKLTVYGLKSNDQRYDIDGPGSVYVAFDDGYVTSYPLSKEEVSKIFQNIDIEFPVVPEYKYLNYGYNPGKGVVLQWKEASDNVGVVGYKVYRAKYTTPSNGSSYIEPYVEIGTTSNTYFIDKDSSLDKSKFYFYYVRAYDLAGNLSFPYYSTSVKIDLVASSTELIIEKNTSSGSDDLSPVSTKDQTAPSAPYNLTTRDVSPSKIDFSWSPSTDNVGVAGYKIYRDEKEISSTKGTSYSDTGLQPGFSYSYYIRAFDAAGNLSQKSSYLTEFTQNSTTVKAVDTQAPTTPANFKVTPISEKRIDLSWSQSSDNVGVTYYKIFRDDKPMFNVNTLKATDIYNLAPNTAYSYHIIACDMAGNCSTRTPSVTEWTLSASKAGTVIKPNLDTQAPSYPPNLVIRSVTTNQIEISWSPSTDNVGVTGYIIYRNNAEISRTTGTSYRDSGLSAGTDYSYNVKAYDAAGNQSYMSNSVTEWTLANQSAAPVTNNQKDTSAPSAPNNVVARSVSTSRIDISWSASTDNVGVMGYKVIRDGNEIASVTGTSFSDNGLQPGSSYSYYIVAYDLAGNLSQRSSYVTEFTQNPPAVINNVVTPRNANHQANSRRGRR